MSKDVGLQTLSSSTDDLENWMSKLPEILKERPIIHLAIPGSHDSISYSISKNSPVSPDTIPFVKQLCKVFGPLVRPYIFKWSLTQHITVTDQLHNGIRYLDLRLATRRQNKDLFIVHGLYGNEIKNTLKEIDLFLTQHPLEIVILDFQHFYDFSVEAHTYMLSTLGQLFGNRLCPLPRDLGQVSLKWMRENWYQIVVIYRDFAAAGISTMWPGNRWPTPWPDTTSCPALFTFLEEKMALRPANAGRTRSLNAPSPIQQFGPCGRIMKNSAMVMTIQDPASQRLTWYKPPLTVLVIKKVRDVSVLQPFVQLVNWLIEEKSMVVFVEEAVMDDQLLLNNASFSSVKDKLMTFRDGKDDLTDKIDFIVCLGGDGTLLYASLLFQQSVPPVMAFHLGSLGFLTPFQFDNFQEQVTNVLEGHAALTLRSRLRCIIVRKMEEVTRSSKPPTNLLVLNEVVIDRGPSPYLSNIDLFLDGKHITSVQGDGLIVSTPTGSTAYAVAAGASMIHPSVPAIMVTPICPHSLSFRPIVVPAGVELKISVSPDSRNTSWVSFDGRNRQELFHGDSLRVTTSIYPVPSICAQDQISDWFDSLAVCLHWNVRKRQKHLDELSDLTHDDLTHSSSSDRLDSLEQSEQLDS